MSKRNNSAIFSSMNEKMLTKKPASRLNFQRLAGFMLYSFNCKNYSTATTAAGSGIVYNVRNWSSALQAAKEEQA